VNAVALSPDGRHALSGGEDRTLRLWDLAAGRLVRTLVGHNAPVTDVRFRPGTWSAVSASRDRTLAVWDLAGGPPVRRMPHADWVQSVAVSPDGRLAVSGSGDFARQQSQAFPVKLWDLDAAAELHAFPGHSNIVHAVALSPDGRTAVTGGRDMMVKLWDVPGRRELRTLVGHGNFVYGVTFLADGRAVLSAGEDGTVRVWDVQDGTELHAFEEVVGGPVHCLAVAGDGQRVVAGGQNGSARVLDFSRPARCRDLAPRARQARAVLADTPGDPESLRMLGEWCAFRGSWGRAAEFLGRARAEGAGVSPLTLAQCYWRLGKLEEARGAFEAALGRATGEPERYYLQLCIDAVAAGAATHPATPAPAAAASPAAVAD
jgi:WD40 repeat protein